MNQTVRAEILGGAEDGGSAVTMLGMGCVIMPEGARAARGKLYERAVRFLAASLRSVVAEPTRPNTDGSVCAPKSPRARLP